MRKTAKTLSRILCGALSICTILAMVSVPAMAFPEYSFKTADNANGLVPATEVLFYENFENVDENSIRYAGGKIGVTGEWMLTNALEVRLRNLGINDFNNQSAGKALYLQPHSTENPVKTAIFQTPADAPYTGEFTVEFGFIFDTDNVPLLYGIGSSTKQSEVENYAIQLYLENAKLYYRDADGTGKEVIDTRSFKEGGTHYTTYALNKGARDHYMYYVKFDIDTVNKKYDLYLNGNICAEDVTFMNADKIDSINVPFAVTPGTAGNVRYDDFKVYREPVGVTTTYANDFSREVGSWTNNQQMSGFSGLGLRLEKTRGSKVTADGSKLVLESVGDTSGAGITIEGMIADDDVTYDVDFEYTPNDASEGKYAPIIGIGGEGQPGIVFSADKDGGIYWSKFNAYSTSNPATNFVKIGEFEDASSIKGHFTFHVDFINENCDLYLDDTLVVKDLAYNYNPSASTRILNGKEYWLVLGSYFNVWRASGNAVKETDITDKGSSWDNLRVSRNVRENILADVLATAGTVMSSASGSMKYSLPTTAPEGYVVEWSADNSAFSVKADGTGTIDRDAWDIPVELTVTVKDIEGQQALSRTINITVPKRDGVIIVRPAAKELEAIAYNAPEDMMLVFAMYDKDTHKLMYVKAVPCDEAKKSAQITEFEKGNYNTKAFVLNLSTLNPNWKAERAFDLK